jgi:N-acetylmuramoyl-L-alanine amidase
LVLAVVFGGACAAAVAATHEVVIPTSGVIKVRLGGDKAETRVVIDLSQSVSAKVDEANGAARQFVLFLPTVGASGVLQGEGRGLVRSWKIDNTSRGGRLALRLDRPGVIRRRFLLPPTDTVSAYRYVIDIDADPGQGAPAVETTSVLTIPAEPAEPAATAPTAVVTAAPVTMAPAPAPRARHSVKVVVIDAGHGGQDPGAQSATHEEKNITLPAARALAARLERDGHYKVVMTRSSDVYVPLEQRVQIARRAGADLFISLHADSGSDAAIHGASVYTLSDQAGGRVTQVLDRHEWFSRMAAREGDPAVGQILLDLTQRSTRNRSSVFAQMLVDRIAERVDVLPRSHRDAGYFVLLAPDVPAVLLEMGFISSPQDEKRLVDPAQRGRLMDAVSGAIDAYFAAQTRLAAR